MEYRVNIKNKDEISALAFGCLRFHKDEKEVEKQIRFAIENGVNYFDTAYTYGKSEEILGKILAKDNLREKVKIATKLPHYFVKKYENFDKYFYTQLERLQTKKIDYYLMHMLASIDNLTYLLDLGLVDWVNEKKDKGEIVNIGFSFHGTNKDFRKIIDTYDWDFCMIQFNYFDEFNQAGIDGLHYAGSKGIPVMIMEPLRGGSLVNTLPKEASNIWDNAPIKRTYADWGLRWVLNHKEVLTVLSGMGTEEMVKENIETVSTAYVNSLSEEELKLYEEVRDEILKGTKVNCTGCGYCIPCPQGVNIPMCFNSLNDTVLKGKMLSLFWYIVMVKEGNASKCVKCGKCEKKCPQNIPIIEKLNETTKELEKFPYKPAKFIASKFTNI